MNKHTSKDFRGTIKGEIFTISDTTNCRIIYRPFSEHAFPLKLDKTINEATIITYTSPKGLGTILEIIKKRYPYLNSLNLVVGLAYSKEDLNHKKKAKDSSSKLEIFKKSFSNGMNSLLQALKNKHWNSKAIKLTLHNHCHIKYFQAGEICLTGSQNFSGTINPSKIGSAFCKNELMISINESRQRLDSITAELLKYLHAHDDEFVTVDIANLVKEQVSIETIFNKLITKRVQSAKGRDKYPDVFQEIDNDYYLEIMEEIELEGLHEERQKRFIAPPHFELCTEIEQVLESDEKTSEVLLSTIKYVEDTLYFSGLTDILNNKQADISESLENYIENSFVKLNDNIELDGIDSSDAYNVLHSTLESKVDDLAQDYLVDLYEEILEHCLCVLKTYHFDCPASYIRMNQNKIADELIQPSPDLLPVRLRSVHHNPDLLIPAALNMVSEMDEGDIEQFAPNFFSSQINSIIKDVLDFESLKT